MRQSSIGPAIGDAGPIPSGWEDTDIFRALVDFAPDAIVVADEHGRILLANRGAEQLFGYRRDEFLNGSIEMLVPERYRDLHRRHRAAYLAIPRRRPMGTGLDLQALRKDGTEFAAEISLGPLPTREGILFSVAIRDISARRLAEARLKASLAEKEVLLKEIHHRVKNNLQVTSSMIKLQSACIEDAEVRRLFAESQHRIRSMALVHEKLYRSSELSHIDLGDYVMDLASLLFRSFGVDPRRIRLDVQVEPHFLGIDTAVPCGLILNELLSNCVKHAFPGDRSGTIEVRLSVDDSSRLTLAVKDDGVGLPPTLDVETADTLGLQLVDTLARQLQAQLTVRRKAGTQVLLEFSELAA